MRIMTGGALAGCNRVVSKLRGSDSVLHVRMAKEAHFLFRTSHHLRESCAMRVVARGAAPVGQCTVFEASLSCPLPLVMTSCAGCISCSRKEGWKLGVVNIVAIHAAISHDRMDVRHLFEGRLVIMAHEAKLVSLHRQLVLRFTSMNVVTAFTGFGSDRPVDILPLALIIVALIAESTPRHREHGRRLSAVRVMTGGTVTGSDRGVDVLLPARLAVVTSAAEGIPLIREHSRRFTRMGIMAGEAISGFYGGMENLEPFCLTFVTLVTKVAPRCGKHLLFRTAVGIMAGDASIAYNGVNI